MNDFNDYLLMLEHKLSNEAMRNNRLLERIDTLKTALLCVTVWALAATITAAILVYMKSVEPIF